MSASSVLSVYLDKVAAGEPVTLSNFRRILSDKGLADFLNPPDFVATSVGDGSAIVTLSSSLKAEVEKLLIPKSASRASAAKSFQSHQVKVNGSLLVAKHRGEHPYVLTFDDRGVCSEGNNRPALLIVENRDTFLRIDEVFTLLPISESNNDLVILLGNGNEVSNTLHAEYLRTFSRIYYYMDIDFGGIKIASNVSKLCHGDASHQFLLPDGLVSTMSEGSIKGKLSLKEKQKIYELSEKHFFLQPACNVLLMNASKAEQESL